MNVNYVKLPELPSFNNYGQLLDALRKGDFFTTTGEVLLPEVQIAASANGGITVKARIQHTFPLEFAEVVWGDGSESHRKIFPLRDTPAFADYSLSGELDAPGWKWVRFAVWDIAADGAFVNPLWRADRPQSSPQVEAVIRTAIALAAEQGKRVLVRYSAGKEFAPIKEIGFVLVNITEPGAAASALVMDGEGRLVDSQQDGEPSAFLARSVPVRPQAEMLLRSALERARTQGKRVLVDFRADWCAPCLRLDRFLHEPEVAAVLSQDFVILSVDLEFARGARELAYKLGSIPSDGLPWTAILDAGGAVLKTSGVDKTNIGYPSPAERDQFLRMFAATAKHGAPERIMALRDKL